MASSVSQTRPAWLRRLNTVVGLWICQWAVFILVAAGTILLNVAAPDWRLVHYPLHAVVESVGAFAAFLVAALILGLRRYEQLSPAYVWVASALIGMGVLDGLHAFHHESGNFVWLHSVATFVGGSVFFLVWVADRLGSRGWEAAVPRAVLGGSLLIGGASIVFPDAIPPMVEHGSFTGWARFTNIAGGLGFLAASFYFVTKASDRARSYVRLLFSVHCFLFGLSGIVFEFSFIWDGTWWFWHGLRLAAYLIAVFFYFDLVRQLEEQLREAKRGLEETVRERTDSLLREIETGRLREASIRKFALAIEHSPAMIIITDAEGVIDYVNPEFTRLTGYSLNDAKGKTPRILRAPTTSKEIHDELWGCISAGQIWQGEIRDRRKDGSEFWVSILISPIVGADGEIHSYVAVEEDVTERREAEQKRHEAQVAAEMANRAKSEMLANMSHELRTPLNAIIGFAQAMGRGLFGPLGSDKYGEYVQHIEDSGQHLLEIINDVLDVSAIEAGKVKLHEEDVDLEKVCESAVRLILPKAAELGVTVRTLGPESPIRVRADRRRLKQVVLNLVSNAIKFTPDGGRVTVSLERDADGAARLQVADTGIGMTEQEIAVALSLFGQVDSGLNRKHEGSGLGLPLTKELVELHGGRLSVRSAPGEGATMTVTLPAARVLPE